MSIRIMALTLSFFMLIASCGLVSEPMDIKVKIENDLLVWDEKANGPLPENIFMISDIHNVSIEKDGKAIEFKRVGNPFFTTGVVFDNGYFNHFDISPQTNAITLEEAEKITVKLHETVLSWGFKDWTNVKPLTFSWEFGVGGERGKDYKYFTIDVENPVKGLEVMINDPRKPAIVGVSDLRTHNLTFQMRVTDLYRYQNRNSNDVKRYKVEANFFISSENEKLWNAMVTGPARKDLGDSKGISAIMRDIN
jgi:hypothetical protein